MIELCISSIASNQGKTILTTALLYHFKESVRPYKIGPDFIDPQFHKQVCDTDSINLDSYMMSQKQVKWVYNYYNDRQNSIIEGVMGFYDGEDKGCSTYSITKLLDIPTLLILDGSGSYITISAVLKGLKTYKNDNTIKYIVLNKLGSKSHFELIKKQILKDFDDIKVIGWIEGNLESLKQTHLGLDLNDLKKIKEISNDVLKHINIDALQIEKKDKKTIPYPFEKLKKQDKTIAVVHDQNFSFLYYDNLVFFKEIFKRVEIIDATNDEKISKNCDIVFICGGYIETQNSYQKISNSNSFKTSLANKKIYAECAGLLYLGNRVDDKKMSAILDIDFTLEKKPQRLGYYKSESGVKGHAFHYTKALDDANGFDILYKEKNGTVGSWKSENEEVYGTYLHVIFRANIELIKKNFI